MVLELPASIQMFVYTRRLPPPPNTTCFMFLVNETRRKEMFKLQAGSAHILQGNNNNKHSVISGSEEKRCQELMGKKRKMRNV